MVTSDLGACEWFVWDLRRSGLIDRGPLDQIVGEFLRRNPRAEAPALAEYLVEQGTLTAFQAERILNGKSQGLVLGPYVLLDAIGSGSMGQVYKASSKNDNNLYAVKVLPRRSMWNVRLARRQVRSFANFTHPAVVPFVDVGTAGGLHYLAWPLVDGQSLEALVQQRGPLPPNLATLYAIQIAQGLQVAHANNLFHGLIKPSNIMIGSDNQARILDFGIGSLLVENDGESLVDTMSTANTLTSGLDCASPESIMEPTNRTPAGDQYSLGCVLYFMLTGRVPFPEGSAVEKMMAHQTREPAPIREFAPDVPPELEDIVKKLMAKSPEARYPSCEELVEALEPLVGDPSKIPGGVPPSPSGSRPALAGLSSGNRPGLGSRSHPSQKPGMPSHAPAGVAAAPTTPPPSRAFPATPARPTTPTARPPLPNPLLDPAAVTASAAPVRTPPPLEPARPAVPNLPTRGNTMAPVVKTAPVGLSPPPSPDPLEDTGPAWAEEADDTNKPTFGTVGLIAAAVLVMVVVYFGATLLMK
ncbi:MAG: protein kinase [Gemmataceae bacterium]|nr:protein kinase [Gemmata sp.]MDW8198623.1 protein kinase [Gemmataceae bacterium]